MALSNKPTSINNLPENFDLVVFSHLRWEFVTQRPQHLISRLAQKHKVLFVEEPIPVNDSQAKGTANLLSVTPNLTVLQPKIDTPLQIDDLLPIVEKTLKSKGISLPVVWFYSAAFVDILKGLKHSLVVYDCMDELTAFKGASKELKLQEKKLLSVANLVFTGGKSLYESKKKFHDNVHCFPSSVDRSHFEKVLADETQLPADIISVPQPIAGYYGVIDERIDLDLLSQIADLRADISFVMIGPVVKIDPESLPKKKNIYYLGGKPYGHLPNYLKAFQIATMPFALNESTKFISPTKTLEFMAALKPIISTSIYDVKRDYSDVLEIITNAQEFSKAIDKYLAETDNEKKNRENKFSQILEQTSWDQTAGSMEKLISDELIKKISSLMNNEPDAKHQFIEKQYE
jgi:glycosyltransferase involved in cell wall biosynthesis